ncbi:hypothetical protein HDU82_005888 [Entophlyctis luteolus]|nr:hypothetical protein HDU82_005888 [Entophlyctis luteolus]
MQPKPSPSAADLLRAALALAASSSSELSAVVAARCRAGFSSAKRAWLEFVESSSSQKQQRLAADAFADWISPMIVSVLAVDGITEDLLAFAEPNSNLKEVVAELHLDSALKLHDTVRAAAYSALLESPDLFASLMQDDSVANSAEIEYLAGLNNEVPNLLAKQSTPQLFEISPAPLAATAGVTDTKFLESDSFMEIFSNHSPDTSVENSVVAEMINGMADETMQLSLYANSDALDESFVEQSRLLQGLHEAASPRTRRRLRAFPENGVAPRKATARDGRVLERVANTVFAPDVAADDVAHLVEATFANTVFDQQSAVASDEWTQFDVVSEMERVVASLKESDGMRDALADHLVGGNSQDLKRTVVTHRAHFAAAEAPKRAANKLHLQEAQTVTRTVHDIYEAQAEKDAEKEAEHLELLGMEVEYFFEREKAKDKPSFLGSGGRILASIFKAVTHGSSITKSIADEHNLPSSVSASSSVDSISHAIVENTREAQWASALDGKKPHRPKKVLDSSSEKGRVNRLDQKLADKPWVSHVYNAKDPFEGSVNPVDAAVDDVMAEGLVPYTVGLELQQNLVKQRISNHKLPNVVLLLEHAPVYTAGRRLKGVELEAERAVISANTGLALIPTARGGQTTFHGPGQIVGYPITDLRTLHPDVQTVRGYVAGIEGALMHACQLFGVETMRTEHTGVWASHDRKPNAEMAPDFIKGVQVSRYVTSHGFALNCDANLRYFNAIVPCGIAGTSATSISFERVLLGKQGPDVTVADAVPALARGFEVAFKSEIVNLEEVDFAFARQINDFLARHGVQ